MQSEAVGEFLEVVVAAFGGVVGGVDSDTEVEPEHEELEVVAQTYACADSERLEERGSAE